MRSFEERLSEIHRRSKLLLQQRKRRRQIALACVPLVIGIVLCGQISHNSGKKGAPEAEFPELGLRETTPCGTPNGTRSPGMVEIRSATIAQAIIAQNTVTQVTQWLDTLTGNTTVAGSATGDNKLSPEMEDTDESLTTGSFDLADIPSNMYIITLTRTDGTRTVYCLADTVLENLTDGGCYTLADSQLQELKQLLGLS